MVGSPKLHFDSISFILTKLHFDPINKDKTPKIYTCTLQHINKKYNISFAGQSHGIDNMHQTIDA